VGGGQGGLSLSHLLQQQGIGHLILEKHRIAQSWRNERWDSFCLVTPNRQCRLPGFRYTHEYGGTDPHGFMLKDEIVAFLEAYAKRVDPPIREGVTVTRGGHVLKAVLSWRPATSPTPPTRSSSPSAAITPPSCRA
jgi:putative flavoprotein involved in K+ transport